MNPLCQELVALLRSELADYGELLRLFDEQQGHLFRRDATQVAACAQSIEASLAAVADHRTARETWVETFARDHAQPPRATLRSLLPLFPAELRPLLGALIDEINHLVHRARRRARQNHDLLRRALELQHELLAQLLPHARPAAAPTYAPTGRVASSAAAPALALHAAG